jgi:hypothetical protein
MKYPLIAQKMLEIIQDGLVIPAHPLALDSRKRFDERAQKVLTRYYLAAGAGGLAVGVHTTQFEIHDDFTGLYMPVLACVAEEVREQKSETVMIAGICGKTAQAVKEAEGAVSLGYHAGLISLSAMAGASDEALIAHCRAVARVIPLMGFYLQPAVGGMNLGYSFWRQFAEIENVVAIKIAPFNRYHTIELIRAIADSGRTDIALYTGNDDNIVADLLTPFTFGEKSFTVAGGLLGHWAFWTLRAVELLNKVKEVRKSGSAFPVSLLSRGVEITDCNSAVFDAKNAFAGCIPGIHEVLKGQGLLSNTIMLDSSAMLSPGQAEEISRVQRDYPHLTDDEFVRDHLEEWRR